MLSHLWFEWTQNDKLSKVYINEKDVSWEIYDNSKGSTYC